jgi:YD repeat-containing protein
MKRSLHLITLVFCMFACTPLLAQTNPNLEIGFKAFGSYAGSDFDTVSLANGNLTIFYPIYSFPQRGSQLKAALRIYYNNKGWGVRRTCNNQTGNCTDQWAWQYPTIPLVPASGTVHLMMTTGAITYTYQNLKNPAGQGVISWSAVTEDGSIHQLYTNNISGRGMESVDATGIYFGGGAFVSPFNYKLIDKHGTLAANGPNGVQDTNGNYIGTTDTMGRNLTPTGTGTDLTGCPANATSSGISSYPGLNGGSFSVKACYANYTLQTNFHAYSYLDSVWISEASTTTPMMVGLIVYNGTDWASSPKWTFDYVSRAQNDPPNINYGDLSKITLPTGGSITYTWANEQVCSNTDPVTPMSRVVASRTVDDSVNGSDPQTTTWSFGRSVETDPAGNQTVHTFTGLSGSCSLYETKTQYYKGLTTTGTLLKTIDTAYSSISNVFNPDTDTPTAVNVHPIRVTTTWPNGKVSKVETDYDTTFNSTYTAGNITEKREYDYGNGAAGPLLRRTDYTYTTANSNYLNTNILSLVTQATVYNGSGTKIAQTNYTFDGTALQASGVTQNHTTGGSYRGNLTLVQKWLNTTGGMVTVNQTSYYDTGMPYQSFDLKGNATTYSYDPTDYGAYVTQTQHPNTGSGNSITHIIKGTYDFNTGLLTSFTDQNNQTSNYGYDVLGRATSGSYPDGGAVTINYTDSIPVQISKTVKVTAALNKVSNTIFDGLGRVSQVQFHDPDCTTGSQLVKTDHTYGFDTSQNTSFSTVTTPYCDTPGALYGLSARTDNDALGRVVKVTQTDGSIASTSYTDNCTTVTDEAGKSRKTCTDGLGRMTGVWEDPNSLNYETDYTYNALDDLLSVTQKGNDPTPANWRPRSFTYDSLSRLLSSTNPEYGNSLTSNLNISYTYSNTTSGCSGDPGTPCSRVAPLANATSGSQRSPPLTPMTIWTALPASRTATGQPPFRAMDTTAIQAR